MIGTKMSKKRIIKNISIAFLILYCFYSYGLQPFFVWKTFANGLFSSIGGIPVRSFIGVLVVVIGLFSFIKRIDKERYILSAWIVFSGGLIVFAGGINHILSFEFLLFLAPAMFIMMNDDIQIDGYKVFYNVFVFSLIIPMIIYILVHVGANIPYQVLESPETIKTYNGIYYKLYPLAVQWNHNWNPLYYGLRFCGIYNEPGVVGTFSALFLCVERYKLKGNWKNIVLFIAGIISFSLAFYLMTIIYFCVRAISVKPQRLFILLAIIVAYFAFTNIEISNPSIQRFQKRIQITSEGIGGDNRTNEDYNALFKAGMRASASRLLFGYGVSAIEDELEANNIDASTYKNLIYDYGVIGFVGQIVWILFFAYHSIYKRNKRDSIFILSFIVVFLINLYQRPFIYSICYYLILVGGLKSATKKNQTVWRSFYASNKICFSTARR